MKYVLLVESAIVTILPLNTDLRCITRYIYNTHRCWYFFTSMELEVFLPLLLSLLFAFQQRISVFPIAKKVIKRFAESSLRR